jgi:hypothetical protein
MYGEVQDPAATLEETPVLIKGLSDCIRPQSLGLQAGDRPNGPARQAGNLTSRLTSSSGCCLVGADGARRPTRHRPF